MAIQQSLGAVVLLLLAGLPASAQLTNDEQACQQAMVKQSGTFLGKKINCVVACDKRALKGKAPDAECLPPFAGKTLECVATAKTKALGTVAKQCAADCPECYAGGDCDAYATGLAAAIEGEVDSVIPRVRCNDEASPDGLTKNEAQAREKVAVAVGKFVTASEKCLAKCRRKEAEGKVPADSCGYLNGTDEKTINCLVKSGNKALDVVKDPKLDAPECLEPELEFALVVASGLVETFDPLLFCGSPSAAFVDQPTILR